MQQDNNNIENKLRQLENQQLPDLSAMDAHWKEMQATLVSNVNPKQKSSYIKNNWQQLLIAASIIAALMTVYLVKYYGKNNQEIAIKKNDNGIAPLINAPKPLSPTDTTIKFVAAVIKGSKLYPTKIKTSVVVLQKDSVNKTILIKKVDSIVTPIAIPQISFENFYAQIQKPAQEFIIDASTGGDINATEGSKIKIPPAAFVDDDGKSVTGKIKILIEEYYKYSDMIAANLTTTSNNEQLVTGGMIKLTAVQNNKQVELRKDKSINLSMPTKNYDADMQLFLADDRNKGNKWLNKTSALKTPVDTVMPTNFYSSTLNWAVTHPVQLMQFDGTTNFLYMGDEPIRVRETRRKRVGIFHITKELPMTLEESKQILKEKYGDYYNVIKVKKVNPQRRSLFTSRYGRFGIRTYIGDSIRATVAEALKWHYIEKKDSTFYAQKTKTDSIKFYRTQFLAWSVNLHGLTKDSFYSTKLADSLNLLYQERLKTEQAYNFTIKKMGWINCDKFYNYDDKTDVVLGLPADVQADKFVTQIVFTNIRSVMPGQYHQNKIGFVRIPKNMPVYVVGLGEKNGKVVSFIQAVKTSSETVSINTLEETTPEAFKEKLKQLDL